LYTILPYDFTRSHNLAAIEVIWDEEACMYFVVLEGKRLYYHRGYKDADSVRRSFYYISIEQDDRSPHRYLDREFQAEPDDVVADLGAAEGNFSLMVVDKVRELYVLEADPVWQEALEMTFRPWKDKVHIIMKYAGSRNDGQTIRLDSIAQGDPLTMVKMDIEGMEVAVLEGSREYMKHQPMKLSITTYHRSRDARLLGEFLRDAGFNIRYNAGYMLFIYDTLTPPYFRKVMVKADKRNRN
jgi:hypothetical protein